MTEKQRPTDPNLIKLSTDQIVRQVEEQNNLLQEAIDSSPKHQSIIENLENRLMAYKRDIESWDSHYDFELWNKTELKFEELWPKMKNSLYLAIEYELYNLVKDVFFDIRHLLQITGYVKERIYLASWIRREADSREEQGAKYLAISSLMGSYISAGCHQDYDKASQYWEELKLFLVALGNPFEHNDYRRRLIKQMGTSMYSELIMDVYESRVRLAVRKRDFNNVKLYTSYGRNEITSLSQESYISKRLKERFDICFTYHEGVTAYLRQNLSRAAQEFEEVINRAEFIGWIRAARGAKSWIATLAMEEKKYDKCEDIIISLLEVDEECPAQPNKRDGICHLIKAQLLSEKGEEAERERSHQKATTALLRFAEPTNSVERLWCAFSLCPCPI